MDVERCTSCGGVIPEGRQVCPWCEMETERKLQEATKRLEEARKPAAFNYLTYHRLHNDWIKLRTTLVEVSERWKEDDALMAEILETIVLYMDTLDEEAGRQ